MSEQSATAQAPSNIAFVKYWGARDLERAIPVNPSISMTLSACRSISTATWRDGSRAAHEVLLEDETEGIVPAPPAFSRRIVEHLDRLLAHYDRTGSFRIETRNTFPAAAGIASSASGFSALTVAVCGALGERPTTEELSDLARRSGSGSASRSVFGGYVEWPADAETTSARQLADQDHWTLCDVIAIVQTTPKGVSSLDGHRRAASSPYFSRRQERLDDKLATVRRAIADRDFETLGPVIEEEAIDLHLIAMSSQPPIYYWRPETLEVLEAVRDLRADGVAAWSTMDAGANVHVVCEPDQEPAVAERLEELSGVVRVLRDRVGPGATLCSAA